MKKTSQINKEAEIYEGLPVLGIVPGSTSDLAGIKRGDVVLEINGMTIKSLDDYVKAINNRTDSMKVKYVRDGVVVETSVQLKSISEKEVKDLANNIGPTLFD